MLKKLPLLALALALIVPLAACASKTVSRVDPGSVTDLSGRWNDTDSRLVARALIQQSLSGPWAIRYSQANGGDMPTVIVGQFTNNTMEHIQVGTFIRDLENAYINSGAVQVVASATERAEIRAEREDQQENARAATRAEMANETGADFMLQGDIYAIEDEEGGEKIVFYQIDATLINLENNVKTWAGQHEIKKYIERSKIGWD